MRPIPAKLRKRFTKGQKFNKLTAIKFLYSNKNKKSVWLFRCDCGNEKAIVAAKVRSGHTKACGCLRGNKKGKLCYAWKGNKVGNGALHQWMRKVVKKPKACTMCNQEKNLDLANKSPRYNKKTYNRNPENWEWLCRRCHMEKDGRLKLLNKTYA